ncbi:hypothetical protein FDECE_10101 [Fusarium decemcellulare]|nr:hypothetical protein FDECE_10101 [Fusarium decemcellulare]
MSHPESNKGNPYSPRTLSRLQRMRAKRERTTRRVPSRSQHPPTDAGSSADLSAAARPLDDLESISETSECSSSQVTESEVSLQPGRDVVSNIQDKAEQAVRAVPNAVPELEDDQDQTLDVEGVRNQPEEGPSEQWELNRLDPANTIGPWVRPNAESSFFVDQSTRISIHNSYSQNFTDARVDDNSSKTDNSVKTDARIDNTMNMDIHTEPTSNDNHTETTSNDNHTESNTNASYTETKTNSYLGLFLIKVFMLWLVLHVGIAHLVPSSYLVAISKRLSSIVSLILPGLSSLPDIPSTDHDQLPGGSPGFDPAQETKGVIPSVTRIVLSLSNFMSFYPGAMSIANFDLSPATISTDPLAQLEDKLQKLLYHVDIETVATLRLILTEKRTMPASAKIPWPKALWDRRRSTGKPSVASSDYMAVCDMPPRLNQLLDGSMDGGDENGMEVSLEEIRAAYRHGRIICNVADTAWLLQIQVVQGLKDEEIPWLGSKILLIAKTGSEATEEAAFEADELVETLITQYFALIRKLYYRK